MIQRTRIRVDNSDKIIGRYYVQFTAVTSDCVFELYYSAEDSASYKNLTNIYLHDSYIEELELRTDIAYKLMYPNEFDEHAHRSERCYCRKS